MSREATMSLRPEDLAESHEPMSTSGVAKEQKITPFDVEGGVDEQGRSMGMSVPLLSSLAGLGLTIHRDYEKTVKRFGATLISRELLERFERLTGHKPHPLMRRGTFFSHRSGSCSIAKYHH